MRNYIFVLLLWLTACTIVSAADWKGNWRIDVLDSSTLALTGEYGKFLEQEMVARYGDKLRGLDRALKIVPEWSRRFHYFFAMSDTILEYRPQQAALLQQFDALKIRTGGQELPVARVGYWLNPIGQTPVPDLGRGGEMLTKNADVAFYLFPVLSEPLEAGKEYTVELPTGETLDWSYRPEEQISQLYKFDQLGFSPRAGRKYAYLGAWLGDAGPLDISRWFGAPFEVVNAGDGSVAFTGTVKPRIPDVSAKTGTPFTGEIVGDLDISEFNRPGRYYFRIAGIGRSADFDITDDIVGDAFYTHMHGLYQARCGVAKEPLWTKWPGGACHTVSYQGNFPPNDTHYKKEKKNEHRNWGFFDRSGRSIDVDHFKLIKQNVPTPLRKLAVSGGWHDAADYDRRPYHFQIVNDLLAVWLMFPDNFSDDQLHLPESGNGLPDIIDEARIGVEVWRQAQQENGGVGTWLEADSHPTEFDPALDQQPYYLSGATRESSLEYAAHASMLALALRECGAAAESELYQNSAMRAFAFALNPANRFQAEYRYEIDKTMQTIQYREPVELPGELLLKAAFNLYELTRDPQYLQLIRGNEKLIEKSLGDLSWRLSPFFFVELERFGGSEPKIAKELTRCRSLILRFAEENLGYLNDSYPYRTPWYPSTHSFVTHMSWGNSHPLRRARYFIMAWYQSGDEKFRDAAYLANNWHNGGNPLGQSMTSALGRVYPARFLDLPSYVDGIAEYRPGITPYRYTYGIAPEDMRLGHSLYYEARKDHNFPGSAISLLPKSLGAAPGIAEKDAIQLLGMHWPVWRRFPNLQAYTVANSEYTVWETMSPAAAVTGALTAPGYRPGDAVKFREPVDDIRKLDGYAPLP